MNDILPVDVQQRKRHLDEVLHDERLVHVVAPPPAQHGIQVAPAAVLHHYVQLAAALRPLCTSAELVKLVSNTLYPILFINWRHS